jgi:outer membrane protein OmpA-like peptidoglycan-associated protein
MVRLILLVLFLFPLVFGFTLKAQEDSLRNNSKDPRRVWMDSILSLSANVLLTPDFYKERYNEQDLMYKITDNKGDGFEDLYGTRNMRPILHGVAYRGGANNYYHKQSKRHNHNPLPDDGVRNLCSEGFSASIYLYRQNFDSAPAVDTCACISGGWNDMQYHQLDYNDEQHMYEALKLIYNAAVNDSVGPVYLHCWNGWHASGLLAALSLRQFCGMDKWEAINYWDLGTDGANNSPRYQFIREIIKKFEPYPDLLLPEELSEKVCLSMPEITDAMDLYIDVEHLIYVPESLPVGTSIVLHNVSFGAGQTTFPNPAQNTDLQHLLVAMRQQPELKLEVGGYTDNTGSNAQNVDLSNKRAKFIYDFLIKEGIAPERLTYKGYGPQNPMYSNKYKATREGNRRIEVKIIEKRQEDFSKLIEEAYHDEKNRQGQTPTPTLADWLNEKTVVSYQSRLVVPSLVFGPNETAVPLAAAEELQQIANRIISDTSIAVEIAGHSDKTGLEENNVALTEVRAKNVAAQLIELGVPSNRIKYKGYGSSMPIASNKYVEGKEKNRRVEIVILPKDSQLID